MASLTSPILHAELDAGSTTSLFELVLETTLAAGGFGAGGRPLVADIATTLALVCLAVPVIYGIMRRIT